MIRIKIDDWNCAHSKSGFYLEVPVVPRVGERIRLHRDICSEDFLEDHQESFSPDAEINGYGYFTVTEVQHSYGPEAFSIEVGVKPDI